MINLMILPVDPVHVQNQLDREIAEMVSVFKSKISSQKKNKRAVCCTPRVRRRHIWP